MTNIPRVTIKTLTHEQMKLLLADDIFKRLFPVRCNNCGMKHDFNRRIFHITGVPKSKWADDETQNWLQYHFLNYHKIHYVFFRGIGRKFYADSASCPVCKSTKIVFDISIDDAMFAYTKITGENTLPFKGKN